MRHPAMTGRSAAVDHWDSLPAIATTLARGGDVIAFRYSHGKRLPAQSAVTASSLEVPLHWYLIIIIIIIIINIGSRLNEISELNEQFNRHMIKIERTGIKM
jgi:hypothetical protein